MAYSQAQPLKMRMGLLVKKNWEEIYVFKTRAEADRGIVLQCNVEVVVLILGGFCKHWGQFSLANDLLIAIQLD